MIERGKISSFQLAIMMNPTILATALLILPSITAAKAERDIWLSPIWGSFFGVLAVWIAYQLHKHYPSETIIEYSNHIIGKIPGKIIGFLYLFLYLHVNGIVIREYGEFISGNFLFHTPQMVILGSMTFVCAFAVRGGLETIARTAQHFVPIVILLWLTLVLFLIKDLELTNMLPILEKGLKPSLLGASAPASWFSEYFLIAFFLPYLRDQKKGLLWGNLSVLSVVFIMVLTNLTALCLFGEITADLTYPVMNAGKYVSIAKFFQHLESMVMAIWVLGTFIKISVFFYVFALGTAQWLKLSNYKSVVFPLGFLLILFARWSAPNLTELKSFLGTSSVFYLLSMQIILPAFLLFITLVRKRVKQRKGLKDELKG